MTAASLMQIFASRGVHFAAVGDRLTIDAPAGTLTDQDRDTLRAHKAEILAAVRQPDSDFDFLAEELSGDDLAQLLADRDAGEAAGLSRDDSEYQAVREWIARHRAERGRR